MTPVFTIAGLFVTLTALGQPPPGPHPNPARVVEIRSYNLKPETRRRFHEQFVRESLPLLRRWRIDVVAYGPSLHDESSYFLIRAFPGIEERERMEQAFYESAEWRNGPRAAVMDAIESYTTVVIQLNDDAIEKLRATMRVQK
jgi:hypothetical protein